MANLGGKLIIIISFSSDGGIKMIPSYSASNGPRIRLADNKISHAG